MTATNGERAPEKAASTPAKKRRVPPRLPSLRRVGTKGESAEAKLQAAVVLEVLGGIRTPTDAAGALGISLPRYYVLEGRALEGLLGALGPRPRGPRRSAERELEHARRDLERVERERARAQALLRAQGRALGLKAPEPAKPRAPGKKRRKPAARALRAATLLRSAGLEGAGGKEEDALHVKA